MQYPGLGCYKGTSGEKGGTMEQRIGSFFHPLSHFYYPSKGHGLTLEDMKWPSSLCSHPTPLALSQTLQLRSPNPGPGLWSQTRRRKRPWFLPGPRRAQRLDCSCRSGGISGQPRVKQRCRHLTGHATTTPYAGSRAPSRTASIPENECASDGLQPIRNPTWGELSDLGGLECRQGGLFGPLHQAPHSAWRTFSAQRGPAMRPPPVLRLETFVGWFGPALRLREKGRGHREVLSGGWVCRVLTFWSQSLPQSNWRTRSPVINPNPQRHRWVGVWTSRLDPGTRFSVPTALSSQISLGKLILPSRKQVSWRELPRNLRAVMMLGWEIREWEKTVSKRH